MKAGRRTALSIACSALAACGPAASQTIVPGINARFTVAGTRDSNILRLPDGVTPRQLGIDTDERDDTVLSPSIDIDASFIWGRQSLRANAVFRRDYFEQLDQFDSRTQSYGATYLWQLGNHWSGELAAGRDEQLTGFQDFLGPQRNVLTVRTERALANWRPRPDRRVALSFDHYDGENSTDLRRVNDFEVRAPRVELVAVTGAGNELSTSYRYTDGNYPNRIVTPTSTFDSSYTQSDADVGVRYAPGGKTLIDARLGYGWRRYETLSDRDYSGPVGRLSITWIPTGKTLLELSAIRDLNAVDELDNLFAVGTVYRAAVRYQMSAQWSLAAEYRRQRLDYQGDTSAFSSLRSRFDIPDEERTDTITNPKIALEWRPSVKWLVNLSREWPERKSSQSTIFDRSSLQYRAHVTSLAIQYSLGPW